MYELTRLEVEHVLTVLRELGTEDKDLFEEEYDQAVEILEKLLEESHL